MIKRLPAACALAFALTACTADQVQNGLSKVVSVVQEVKDTIETGSAFIVGQIPSYCAWGYDAHAQFLQAKADLAASGIKIGSDIVNAETRSVAALAAVCNDPPTTLADAIKRFKPAYQAFRNAISNAQSAVKATQ